MNRSDSQLVLRDIPVFLWIFGFIFAVIGALVIYEKGQPSLPGVALVALGLAFLLFTSVLTITADRVSQSLKLEYRSVLRHKVKEVPFGEIAGINVDRTISSGKHGASYTYRLSIFHKDGKVIPFRSFSSSGYRKKEQRAVQLREFIGIQESNLKPAGMLPRELSKPGEIFETNGVHWQIQPMMTYGADSPTGVRWHSPDFKTPGIFLFIAQKAEGQSSTGFLASLGTLFVRQALALHGFQHDDTPGLEQAAALGPLDPSIEPHFMAYTNAAASGQLLNPYAVQKLAEWAGRYPLKQFRSGSAAGQLMILFGPNGLFLADMKLAHPDQARELASLGAELVRSQSRSNAQAS